MKLKDIPEDADISMFMLDFSPLNVYIDTPLKEKGYIISMWNRGMWIKEDMKNVQTFPLCFNCELTDINDKILDLDIINE
jgi:hypothetical protein